MGVRLHVWALAALCLAAGLALLVRPGSGGDGAAERAGSGGFERLRASEASGAAGATDARSGSRARADLPAGGAGGDARGASSAAASRAPRGPDDRRAGLLGRSFSAGSGPASLRALRSRESAGAGADSERRAQDRALEREVAELGRALGIPGAVGAGGDAAPGDAAPDASPDAGGPSAGARDGAAATSVAIEYVLRQELFEVAGGKLLPYGYPVGRLRSEVAAQVAGLTPAARRSLLERAQQALAENPAPPIMSHPESGNVYAGPDADPAPTGVDIADSPVHVLPQGEGNRY